MHKILTLLCTLLLFISCSNDDDDRIEITNCNSIVIENNDMYYATISPEITALSLVDNCLTISYSASGCDGSTWEEELVANTDIAESDPIQRYLALELNNLEICQAIISKEMSFDLSPIQVSGTHRILLNLQGWNEAILYEY